MRLGRAPLVRRMAAALQGTGLIHPVTVAACYARRRPVFQVLTYHRVNDDRDPFFPAVPTEVFERHMACLARHYRVLAPDRWGYGRSSPRRSFAGRYFPCQDLNKPPCIPKQQEQAQLCFWGTRPRICRSPCITAL